MGPQRLPLVVLGSGFGAFTVVTGLGTEYDVTVVSPRNHFLFTPLLPSTTVGTIEFRSIIEPIRHARADVRFFHALAHDIDVANRAVSCVSVDGSHAFRLSYDVLVIAVGAASSTFGVPGVAEHALFLRELNDARLIRQRIIGCFERANLPGISTEERSRLLHFVICGGGPTGVEVAAEIHDFFTEDLRRFYPLLVKEARITIVEAMKDILSGFDESLRRYALEVFRRKHITVLTDAPVTAVEPTGVVLADHTRLSCGLLLWSAGNGPTEFARTVPLPKDERGRLLVDDRFLVRTTQNVFAIGDCSAREHWPLPATAQVAQQEGRYLAHALRLRARGRTAEPFRYRHLGMLAYIGGRRALADLESFKGRGWATWLFWRSAYLTRLVSAKNKVLVLFDWVKHRLFGRDVSQF